MREDTVFRREIEREVKKQIVLRFIEERFMATKLEVRRGTCFSFGDVVILLKEMEEDGLVFKVSNKGSPSYFFSRRDFERQ